METPQDVNAYTAFGAGELRVYVANDLLADRPGAAEILVAVDGYGSVWLHLDPPGDE